MRKVIITCDGGCSPNPGPGGWGAVLEFENGERKRLSGGDPDTTNNLMELSAAAFAVASLEEQCEIEIRTDSQLVVNYISNRPGKKWKSTLLAVRLILTDARKALDHKITVLKVDDSKTIVPHQLATAEMAKFKAEPRPMYVD